MSAKDDKKKGGFLLKKAAGPKPPNRAALRAKGKGGLGRGLDALIDVQSPGEGGSCLVARGSCQESEEGGASATNHESRTTNHESRTTNHQPRTTSHEPPTTSHEPRTTSPAAGGILLVPPLDVARCPWQPRVDFDEQSLAELAESIRANGVIQPLVCRRRADGKLELIAGERRLRASVTAGLDKVPVVLVDASDRKAAEMAVIENIQRRDLNVIEEAEGYRLLKEQFQLRQEDVADRVGKSRPAVANALRLLELPDEVKQLLTQNLISTGHAKVLLALDDEKERILLARDCVSDGLTVRALERKIQRRREPPAPPRTGEPDMPEAHVRALVDELNRTLGCAVRLTSGRTLPNGKHVKGVLEIDFADNDGLDRVLAALGVRLD